MPQACGSCPGPWFEVIGYFEPIPEEEHSDKANKLKLARHSLSIQRYKQEQCLLLQSRSVQFYWGKSQNLMVDHASVVYRLPIIFWRQMGRKSSTMRSNPSSAEGRNHLCEQTRWKRHPSIIRWKLRARRRWDDLADFLPVFPWTDPMIFGSVCCGYWPPSVYGSAAADCSPRCLPSRRASEVQPSGDLKTPHTVWVVPKQSQLSRFANGKIAVHVFFIFFLTVWALRMFKSHLVCPWVSDKQRPTAFQTFFSLNCCHCCCQGRDFWQAVLSSTCGVSAAESLWPPWPPRISDPDGRRAEVLEDGAAHEERLGSWGGRSYPLFQSLRVPQKLNSKPRAFLRDSIVLTAKTSEFS